MFNSGSYTELFTGSAGRELPAKAQQELAVSSELSLQNVFVHALQDVIIVLFDDDYRAHVPSQMKTTICLHLYFID